jgi:hypothetical protein
MALLTIPATVSKGVSATVGLNKSELFQLSLVASDSYFSVQTNVRLCIVEYRSTQGNQRHVLKFDLSQATPSDQLLLSTKARNTFELQRIILEDHDKGTLILRKSDLPSGLSIVIS